MVDSDSQTRWVRDVSWDGRLGSEVVEEEGTLEVAVRW